MWSGNKLNLLCLCVSYCILLLTIIYSGDGMNVEVHNDSTTITTTTTSLSPSLMVILTTESELVEFLSGAGNNSADEFERQIYFPESPRGKGWKAGSGWSPPGPGKRRNKFDNNGEKTNKHNTDGGGMKHKQTPVYTFGSGTDIAGGSGREVICDRSDVCHYFVHCASYPYNYLKAKDRCCYLRKQSKGMCCSGIYPSETGAESIGNHFRPYERPKVKIPSISEDSLQSAARFGYGYRNKYKEVEVKLLELNIIVDRGTPAYGHLQFFQTTPEVLEVAANNFLVIKASSYIQDTYDLSPDESGIALQEYNFLSTVLGKTCPATPSCEEPSRYRTIDGSCNNLRIPKLGQANTPLLRLLPPDYADGIWSPRVRKDGRPLPNPRFITRNLVPDVNQPDPRYSHLVMQFGQFVDHDFSHVPIFRLGDMSGIECCKDSYNQHPACFPISIPPNDPILKGNCMNFVRSMIAPRISCDFGHADQLNQLTHWLDASQIYGNSADQGESLRQFSGGLLKVTRDPQGRHLLPLDLLDKDDCINPSGSGGLHCFVAGDKRVNEQIGLTGIHTIWLREHNRVAVELSSVNLNWEDETIYQEARKIVIAEYQHIVYNEWLPIIVGRNYMEVFGILPLYKGFHEGYSPSVDPTVSNAFTTAAFRMGHTLVQGMFNLQNSGGAIVGRLNLRDFFNNPHLLREPGFIDLLNKGLVTQPIQMFDNFVTTELRDHLFKVGSGNAPGMDLIALNIQRGRDHGLPSYNEYRDLCRLGKARDFQDLQSIVSPRKIPILEQIYESVDDIDLFIGGIFETPLQGALVGPTFVCILGDQFVRSQKADRFFYSNGGEPHSFSTDQLHAIRTVSMARIMCDNSDEIRSIQPLVFHLPDGGFNPVLPCGTPSIPRLDINLWIE